MKYTLVKWMVSEEYNKPRAAATEGTQIQSENVRSLGDTGEAPNRGTEVSAEWRDWGKKQHYWSHS